VQITTSFQQTSLCTFLPTWSKHRSTLFW
jgi:hypothetical protein